MSLSLFRGGRGGQAVWTGGGIFRSFCPTYTLPKVGDDAFSISIVHADFEFEFDKGCEYKC